jgi:hypothetical protein
MKRLRFQQKNGAFSLFGRTAILAAILLIGLVSYLASNPEAHEYFHPDAGHENHECVITAFAAGEGFQLQLVIVVQPRLAEEWARPLDKVQRAPERTDYALLPICGPPSAV